MTDFIIGVTLVLLGFWLLRLVAVVLAFYYRRSKAIKEGRYREEGIVMNPKTGELISQRKPDV